MNCQLVGWEDFRRESTSWRPSVSNATYRRISKLRASQAPARYRALRIRFDPPGYPPPNGGSRVRLRVVKPLRGGRRPDPQQAAASAVGTHPVSPSFFARQKTELSAVEPHPVHD